MAYIAANSPVADWRCVPEGEGYGNYYDPVTDTWATVTRTTPKTARTADGRIVDVPAGNLALEPWSLHESGGVGLAAIIEEARTNYLLNSYGADNNGSRWTGWTRMGAALGVESIVSTGAYGLSQRFVSSGGGYWGLQYKIVAGSFAAGDAVCASAFIDEVVRTDGATAYMQIVAYDSADVYLGETFVLFSTAGRKSVVYSALPSNTSHIAVRLVIQNFAASGNVLQFSAVQIEKGLFPTSYIPTTTAAVTRAADVVTVPTTGWSAAVGTMAASVGTGNLATDRGICEWFATSSNRMELLGSTANSATFFYPGGFDVRAAAHVVPGVMVGRWATGAAIRLAFNGTLGQRADTAGVPVGLPATATIGFTSTRGYFNGPIARLTVYDKALSDEQLVAADMTTDLLAGLDTARITNEVTL